MKHFNIVLCIAALLAICACSGEDPFKYDVEGGVTLPQGNDAFPYITLTKAEQGVSTGANAFGIGMFKDLSKDLDYKENAVFSPFSLSLALSLTASGAQGGTLSEMTKVLGFEGYSTQEIGSYYNKLVTALTTVDKGTVISSANAVWTARELKKDYVTEVTGCYDANVEKMDFKGDPAGCTNAINDWTKKKTNGLIKKLFDDNLEADVSVILTNALYFKGQWSRAPYRDTERDFNGIDGKTRQCGFFSGTHYMLSYFGKDASVIKLPYGNCAFSMVFVLPAEGTDFRKFVSYLTPERWEQWMAHLADNNVLFSIPVFKDNGDFKNLKDFLEKKGMVAAFGNGADFSRMSDTPLYISRVLQKATIDVNASGTEAAAVSAVEMKDGATPDEADISLFVADRPFLYAIVENSHNTLLFIGQHVTAGK